MDESPIFMGGLGECEIHEYNRYQIEITNNIISELTCETMKTVYSASNISLVSIFQNILEGYGIKCWIKNEFLFAGIGEIPPIECWPLLCVNDDDFEEAKRIVDEALSEKDMPVWKCDSCGEIIEGQFTECWNCGKSRIL